MKLYGQGRYVEQDAFEQRCEFSRRGDQNEFSFPFVGLKPGEVSISELRVFVHQPDERNKPSILDLPDQGLLVKVVEKETQAAGVVIQGGIQLNVSELENLYGADIKNLINIGVDQQNQQKESDIKWQPILFRFREESTHEIVDAAKQIVPGFHGRFYESQRLCLQVRRNLKTFNLGLVAKTPATLGKKRDNDIVLRVLPPTNENNELSGHISRRHAEIEFSLSGVLWRNLGQHGTIVGDEYVSPHASSMLSQGVIIRPSDVVSLQAELFFGDMMSGDAAYSKFAKQFGRSVPHPAIGDVRAVRLRRHDSLADSEYYIIFQRAIAIGNAVDCSVRIEDSSLAPHHAQILWFGNTFWLEPIQKSRSTFVDGHSIPPDHLVPLRPNMEIQAGDTEISVTRYQQFYLDIVPEIS